MHHKQVSRCIRVFLFWYIPIYCVLKFQLYERSVKFFNYTYRNRTPGGMSASITTWHLKYGTRLPLLLEIQKKMILRVIWISRWQNKDTWKTHSLWMVSTRAHVWGYKSIKIHTQSIVHFRCLLRNLLTHLRWSLTQIQLTAKLHLRCLTRFWICLFISTLIKNSVIDRSSCKVESTLNMFNFGSITLKEYLANLANNPWEQHFSKATFYMYFCLFWMF